MQLAWTTFMGSVAMSALMALVLVSAGGLAAVRYRPRLRYALWLLVLVKLIPLPGVQVSILWPTASSESKSAAAEVTAHDVALTEDIAVERTSPFGKVVSNTTVPTMRTTPQSRAQQLVYSYGGQILPWLALAMTVGLYWKSLAQMRQVAQLIDCAPKADERLTRLAAGSSRLMNLQSIPEIRIINARISPLLWSQRTSPTIVLPAGLVERLDDDQIRCIICHEIAHHQRRDPWVNLFAFLTAAAYWWNPLAWWARREMLSAQEECCDATVISRPGLGRRKYAEALFETIEFLNEECSLTPVLASGFGSKSFTRRRFDMIADSKLNRRVLGLVLPLVIVLGIAFVSSPVRGQAEEKEGEANPTPAAPGAPFAVDVLDAAGHMDAGYRFQLGDTDAAGTRPTDIRLYMGDMMADSFGHDANTGPVERRTTLRFDGKAEVQVDPRKHCLYIGIPPYEGCENGSLRIDLEKGVTYTVRCSGEAFMSEETGEFADPYGGIFFAYQSDQQDCHQIHNRILKPGDEVTFTTPTCLGEHEDVFAVAFFVQAWKHAYWPEQRGGYTLSFTQVVEE